MNPSYYVLGYVVLRMDRAYAERVLNLCMHGGIVYLDGGSEGETLRFCLRAGHARRLCEMLAQAEWAWVMPAKAVEVNKEMDKEAEALDKANVEAIPRAIQKPNQ